MPICITCSTPVKNLYTTYSRADDRSLGKGVRLTQCPHCKRFADKYVEHDFVVLFIDLVLIKPQVYRHLLFNRLARSDDKLDPSILRLGTLLLLFDVYLTWARVERSLSSASSQSPLSSAPILLQYLFFLTLNSLATAAHHGTVRLLVRVFLSPGPCPIETPSESATPASSTTWSPSARPASAAAVSTALLVSSCTKLFPILLVIWPETPTPTLSPSTLAPQSSPSFVSRARSYVGWAVLLNNIEALLILLDCGYASAIGLAGAGAAGRWVVERVVLGGVGLEGDGGVVGDLLGVLERVRGVIGR